MATKLYIPPVRPGLVSRPRLLARLDQGLHCRLILLSGPAGGGKTTLLSEWLAQATCPAAWLSLEPGDSDPARFLGYLIAALRTVLPDVGKTSEALLRGPQPPPFAAPLAALINDLVTAAAPGLSFVLVLDDYHAIASPAIHDGVTFLLEHLPPQMHLVIATRTDPPLPLSRFRSRGQMAEIRAADLRFTAEEAAAFLDRTMGLDLAPQDVAILGARTEGWVAGLQLAALSMHRCDAEGVQRFIAGFSGRQHHILDYLTDEVLGCQPEQVQAFLLETSILERLCGPLCDAVTGRTGGQAMLEALERANLFLVSLDDERRWYRYHHLFAELLQSQLLEWQPTPVSALHLRASEWFEKEHILREAISHALAAQGYERAALLIEASADQVLYQGEVAAMLEWLATLPQEIVRSHPRLGITYGLALFAAGFHSASELHLESAEAALADAGLCQGANVAEADVPGLRGQVLLMRAFIARYRGDHAQARALTRQALELIPEDELSWRGLAQQSLGGFYREGGDLARATEFYAEAVRLLRLAGNLFGATSTTGFLVRILVMRGQLRRAFEAGQEALEAATGQAGSSLPPLPALGMLHTGLGTVLWQWDDPRGAEQHLRQAIELGEVGGYHEFLVYSYLALARIRCAHGEAASAQQALSLAVRAMQRGNSPETAADVAGYQGWLLVTLGDLDAAEQWLKQTGLDSDGSAGLAREREYLALARLWLAQGKPGQANELLARLLPATREAGRVGCEIEILVLQALALRAEGHLERALQPLAQALALAEPEGYVRIFADEGPPMAALLRALSNRQPAASPAYLARLLATLGAAPAQVGRVQASAGSPLEPLSARELEVLRLLADGLTNQEVAQRLCVTLATVKSHTLNIYGKLGVHSRRQAAAAATRLGILA